MLDKVLTGENVKVNGEIAGRRHILRTLHGIFHNIPFISPLGHDINQRANML